MSELSEGSEGSEVSELSEVSEETTACGRTHHSPQSEERSSERLGIGVPHEASDLPGVGGRTGTASSLSPTHKGRSFYHIRLSIGRSGLCPSDRRLRCVGPLTRSLLQGIDVGSRPLYQNDTCPLYVAM